MVWRNATIPKNIIMGIVKLTIISKLRNTISNMDCSGVTYYLALHEFLWDSYLKLSHIF